MNIEKIHKLIEKEQVKWSQHILKRMQQRGIKINEVIQSIKNGEIIEKYIDDYPYPSCLIFGFNKKGNVLHTVCSIGQKKLWMITAYYPDFDEWEEDLKTRR